MSIPTNIRSAIQGLITWIQSTFRFWLFQRTLLSLLFLGLLEGLIYAAIIPPWWHYDEPGHFEYAWLAANSPTWPQVGQYDQEMRRELGNSLMKYGWYQIRNFHPDLKGTDPIVIGVPQVGDSPGYYFLASLPLRLMRNVDIIIQYYAARSISFLLYLLIIFVVWCALGEILSKDHPLRWMVPAFAALLPAFVDTMTSVNNDVIAVLAASFFLWASFKLMMKGYSVGRLAFLFTTLVLCYLSKNTAWFTFILAPFVLLFSIRHGEFIRVKLGLTAIVFFLAIFTALQWGSPLAWYQVPATQSLPRIQTVDSPAGAHAFMVGGAGINPGGQIMQFLSRSDIKPLQGKTMTLGAWMWASHGAQIESPAILFLIDDGRFVSSPSIQLNLSDQPMFYRQTILVPMNAVNGTVHVRYASQAVSNNQIFFNGLALTAGEFSSQPPQFTGPNEAAGRWDGRPFQNLIRNGSADQVGLRLKPRFDEKTTELLSNHGINPPLILVTIQDVKGTGQYYRDCFATLFRTFWASLAGDKVTLPGSPINYFLFLVTLIGTMGATYTLWIRRKGMRWDMVIVLAMAFVFPWMLAATRGVSGFVVENPLYPWARYAYPGILPTILALCVGWLELLEFFKAQLKFTDAVRNAIFLGGMFGLSGIAMFSAVQAFHQDWWQNWGSLIILIVLQFAAFFMIERISSRQLHS